MRLPLNKDFMIENHIFQRWSNTALHKSLKHTYWCCVARFRFYVATYWLVSVRENENTLQYIQELNRTHLLLTSTAFFCHHTTKPYSFMNNSHIGSEFPTKVVGILRFLFYLSFVEHRDNREFPLKIPCTSYSDSIQFLKWARSRCCHENNTSWNGTLTWARLHTHTQAAWCHQISTIPINICAEM